VRGREVISEAPLEQQRQLCNQAMERIVPVCEARGKVSDLGLLLCHGLAGKQ
jgi:hypothetical protein